MDLSYILSLYLIVFIIIIISLCKYGIHIWSAIIISLVICWLLLNILMPPNEIDEDNTTSSLYALYFLIQILSFIIIIIYALICASKDYTSDYINIKIHSKHIDTKTPFIEIL